MVQLYKLGKLAMLDDKQIREAVNTLRKAIDILRGNQVLF